MRRDFAKLFNIVMFVAVALQATKAMAQQWAPKGPLARVLSSAVWDATMNRMVVYGGDAFNSCEVHPNDVWWLNSATATGPALYWTKVQPSGSPPAARVAQTAVYASVSSRMIVFGGGLGCSSPCASDTWILDNANGAGGTPAWIPLSPSGSLPPPRLFHTAVYDPNTNSMIVFGGNDCFSTDYNDVWVLGNADGTTGTPAWTQLAPTGTAPSARGYAAAVYDPANNIMVLYGGNDDSGLRGDVWVLSHANGVGGTPAWTQLAPSGAPAPRGQLSAIYDATNNRMTIFGGQGASGALGDVWVLSNANGVGGTPAWSQLVPPTHFPPQPRYGHTAVYNPASNVMTIFGGSLGSSPAFGYIPTNDVFVLTHANGL